MEHALDALRRLSMAPMTLKVDHTTGVRESMAQLQATEALQAAAQAGDTQAKRIAELFASILSTWDAQLEEERRQRTPKEQPPSKPGPKPRPRDPSCAACKGKHRGHTCVVVKF